MLVREFCASLITAVYIPMQAPSRLALVLPKFHCYIILSTQENNILEQVYSNIPGAYEAVAAPHLGISDHISV